MLDWLREVVLPAGRSPSIDMAIVSHYGFAGGSGRDRDESSELTCRAG